MTRFVAFARRPYHTWRMRISLTLLLLAAAALLPPRAVAVEPTYEAASPIVIAQRDCLSLSQATAQVRRSLRPGDRIVGASTKVRGGCEVHQIKVLTKDGKVRTRTINGCCR